MVTTLKPVINYKECFLSSIPDSLQLLNARSVSFTSEMLERSTNLKFIINIFLAVFSVECSIMDCTPVIFSLFGGCT